MGVRRCSESMPVKPTVRLTDNSSTEVAESILLTWFVAPKEWNGRLQERISLLTKII